MTPEERREAALHSIETDIALLDRIDYHRRRIIEDGGTPSTSQAWIAFHRRQVVKRLARLSRVLPQAEMLLAAASAKLAEEQDARRS